LSRDIRSRRHDVRVPLFYLQTAVDRVESQPSTAGPWGPGSQHGGPPAALLARAVEQLERGADRMVGRFTMELLGPVPVGRDRFRVAVPGQRPRPRTDRGRGCRTVRRRAWSGGYLDAVEWRWISGAVDEPGPAVVWMRPRVELVAGEQTTAVQRLLACVDSASGVSATLGTGAVGTAVAEVYDERGLVARSAQALLISARETATRTRSS
jgi:hypothetical protein